MLECVLREVSTNQHHFCQNLRESHTDQNKAATHFPPHKKIQFNIITSKKEPLNMVVTVVSSRILDSVAAAAKTSRRNPSPQETNNSELEALDDMVALTQMKYSPYFKYCVNFEDLSKMKQREGEGESEREKSDVQSIF